MSGIGLADHMRILEIKLESSHTAARKRPAFAAAPSLARLHLGWCGGQAATLGARQTVPAASSSFSSSTASLAPAVERQGAQEAGAELTRLLQGRRVDAAWALFLSQTQAGIFPSPAACDSLIAGKNISASIWAKINGYLVAKC